MENAVGRIRAKSLSCKTAGSFRDVRNVAAKLQEAFATCETLPQNRRKLSRCAKRCRKTAGSFRDVRNIAAKSQEAFAMRETLPQNRRSITENPSFIIKN
ncbi:hypothetical protein B5F77_12030 [Parabacteroides sp. An277]|uniref:hypothetical protein n=1 Tax=Parabacteroides sp. An277 TaxID=1965619 RepID=UPI000B3994D2|nr:hypothetical protein [Parabacteroides sp. An277]OUO50828.1 hypothetical protein B5F77_12030 [Parabacteroides sp. An277]